MSASLDLARWIRPGDGVVIGQACAEPVPLVDALLAQAGAIGGVRAFVGLTYRDLLSPGPEAVASRGPQPTTSTRPQPTTSTQPTGPAQPITSARPQPTASAQPITSARPQPTASGRLAVVSYGGLGRTGRIAGLRVVPCHFSALPSLFAARALPGDVALIQVAPPDSDGRCSLGVGADYLLDAISYARVVVAEVNARCPATSGAWVPWDRLDAVIHTDRPLLEAPRVKPGDVERRIAEHVAALVRDGDTIQLGVGALPEAILSALHGHRDLGVHSGMISDGVLDLIEAGAVTNAHKPADRGVTVTGAALGSARLFDALSMRDDIRFAPVSYTHAPATLARVGRLCAINSAVEIDLAGNCNAESFDGRVVGAVGGQVDFLRAAAASGGTPVIALPAQRIVDELHGPVSTARSDVDWVVTEHGARSLRGLTDAERARALRELRQFGHPRGDASPKVREEVSR